MPPSGGATANLQGASLQEAQLQGADLRDAQLRGADLYQAQLQAADLSGAQLQGADLRGAAIWRAQVLGADWDLADLRGGTVQPMTESDIATLINEATKGIADEDTRSARTDTLTAMLQSENSPRSEFPKQWRSEPNVMFETSNPQPERFEWGDRKWTTERAYDEDLGKLLGELACGEVAEAQTRGLARRALEPARAQGGEPERLWPRVFAALVIGADCPPAKGLPDDMRHQLEELAAQGDAAVASPEASPPDPVE